jgi:cytoskeletal protein CcmA (bactofilin family)
MKRIVGVLAATLVGVVSLMLPQGSWAQEPGVPVGQPVVMPGIRLGAPYIGDLYFKSGEEVRVNEEVRGDAYVAGGRVEVDGRVRGDLLAAGGEVWIRGQVDQDLRVAGGEVTIDGQVDRNVTVAGGKVTLTDNALIAGNLVAAGGEVQVSDQARIAGKQVIKTPPQKDMNLKKDELMKPVQQAMSVLAGVAIVVKWLSTLVMGLLLVAVFPKTVGKMMAAGQKRAGNSLLWGAVFSLVAPIMGVLLLFTLIGLPLGLLTLVAVVVAWYVGKLVAMVYVGQYVLDKVKSHKLNLFAKGPNQYVSFLTGALVFLVLGLVPLLGWFAKLLLVWIGVGVLVQEKWAWYRQAEK